MSLETRIQFHNWDSLDAWEVLKRLEIIKEAGALPGPEFSSLMRSVGPKKAVIVTKLVREICK